MMKESLKEEKSNTQKTFPGSLGTVVLLQMGTIQDFGWRRTGWGLRPKGPFAVKMAALGTFLEGWRVKQTACLTL